MSFSDFGLASWLLQELTAVTRIIAATIRRVFMTNCLRKPQFSAGEAGIASRYFCAPAYHRSVRAKRILSVITIASLSVAAGARQPAIPPSGQGAASREDRTGGTRLVSPSVVASYSGRRDASGVFAIDILILWRGSPGWMF